MPYLFSNAEYAHMVYVYGLCDGNATNAVDEYRRRFPNRRTPSRRVFVRTFQLLLDTGSVPSASTAYYDRAIADNEVERDNIIHQVQRSPRISTRRISRRVGVPQSRVWRTLNDEGMYPYHLQRVQHLQPADYARRIEFSAWLNEDRRLHQVILFSDEAQFTRDGVFNMHNSHVWSQENPHEIVTSNFQRRFSCNVWCGMLNTRLIGPFILEGRLTGQRYLQFLREELPPLLEDVPLHIRQGMYFQHDGAPPHFSRQVVNYLNGTFTERWIGRGSAIPWPARSPRSSLSRDSVHCCRRWDL